MTETTKLAATFAAVLMMAGASLIDLPAEAQDCTSVYVGELAPIEMAEYLIEQGWEGDPTDGVEALYPPGCLS